MDIDQHIIDLHKMGAETKTEMKNLVERFDRTVPFMARLDERMDAVEKTQAVTVWKLGTLSAAAGAALTLTLKWVGARIFGIHS